MKNHTVINLLAVIGGLAVLWLFVIGIDYMRHTLPTSWRSVASLIQNDGYNPPTVSGTWSYTFDQDGILHEAGSMEESSSPYWWLSSGGRLIIENGQGRTISMALQEGDRWRVLYDRSNPLDTDDGRYPQNLFRLLTKSVVGNSRVQASFEVRAIHTTNTPNRDGYSGFFIISRYQDADNLYYAGVRQDGHAVIKKKINGMYYTLAETPLFLSERPYEKNTNPNFLPGLKWMRLRFDTEEAENGLSLALHVDEDGTGFKEVLQVTDDGTGGAPHFGAGSVGLRSDYMDVVFDDFVIETILESAATARGGGRGAFSGFYLAVTRKLSNSTSIKSVRTPA